MLRTARVFALIALCSVCLYSQSNLTGTWQTLGYENAPWVFTFKVEGNTVTGTAKQCAALREEGSAITDGKLEGNTISFKAQVFDGERTVLLLGTVKGDEIVFTRGVTVRPGGSVGIAGLFGAYGPPEFIAKRVETATPCIR